MKKSFYIPFLLVMTTYAFSQEEEPSFLPNEGTVAIGVAFPLEQDPLNVPGEEKIPAAFSFDLGYRRFLTDRMAVGIRGFGYVKKLPGYLVRSVSDPSFRSVDFDLVAFNVGVEGLALLSDGIIQPYAIVMLNYATGSISDSHEGTLQYDGVAAGLGFGVRAAVSTTVAVSLEGLGSWGTAKWRERPFSNSNGDTFDPGMIGLLATVSFRWE